MRRYLPFGRVCVVVIILIVVSCSFAFPLKAQDSQTDTLLNIPQIPTRSFEETYTTYLALLDSYRTRQSEYVKAYSSYRTYGTIVSQTAALESLKNLLVSRDEVLLAYNDLLFLRTTNQTFKDILFAEKIFITAHKNKIPAVSTFADAIEVSLEIERHYPVFVGLAQQVSAALILSRVEAIDATMKSLDTQLTDMLALLRSQGLEVGSVERWSLNWQAKLQIADQNLNQAKVRTAILGTKNGDDAVSELAQIRALLFSVNQYYKEALAIYSEFLKEVKYGNY